MFTVMPTIRIKPLLASSADESAAGVERARFVVLLEMDYHRAQDEVEARGRVCAPEVLRAVKEATGADEVLVTWSAVPADAEVRTVALLAAVDAAVAAASGAVRLISA